MGRRTESWLAQQWSSPTFTTSPNHSCYISEFLVSVYSVYFHSFHIICEFMLLFLYGFILSCLYPILHQLGYLLPNWLYCCCVHAGDVIVATYLDPKDLIRADAVLVEEADLIQSMGLCSLSCCFRW
ncbi:uncharacterized protein LOC118481884 isoform X2 [Helianthus annuus]|uniref:uncharacterized protein LOC118481884 isoform X2 n=1 Tax=Helianthus annuus TaxID=4232 RepID=UPI001652EE74|nr:uncharacterized protein LOC118481884 isoform X2 [Helianthus annuus]